MARYGRNISEVFICFGIQNFALSHSNLFLVSPSVIHTTDTVMKIVTVTAKGHDVNAIDEEEVSRWITFME